MPSSKSLFAALGLLCLTLPLLAEKPAGKLVNNDSRQKYPSQETKIPIPRELGGKTYQEWRKDLSHPDPSVRANAISIIPGFREDAMDAIPLLISRTNDTDASPRVKAVLALKVMGINGADREHVVKALGERIAKDPETIVRYEAAQALTRFGADGQKVIGDMVAGLGSRSTWELRHACIIALIVAGADEKKGPEEKVTNALILRTKPFYEPTRQVRLEAIIALGALGRPHAPKALQMVIGALKEHERSTDKGIRIWTFVSLMALEDKVNKSHLEWIVKCLDDRDREVRVQAVTALGAMKEKADNHVKDICEMLRHEKEPMVQAAACTALGSQGNKGSNVLKALIRMTELNERKTNNVTLAACKALAQLHVANADVMKALKDVLDHSSLEEQEKDLVRASIEAIQKPLPDEAKPKDKPKIEKAPARDK